MDSDQPSTKNRILKYFEDEYSNNQFFHGGVLLMVVTVGSTLVARYGYKVYKWAMDKVTVRVELDSRDDCFRWVLDWLSDQDYAKRVTNVVATTNLSRIFGRQKSEHEQLEEESGPKIYYTPNLGTHYLPWRNKNIWLVRKRESNTPTTATNALNESLEVVMWGTNRSLITLFMEEVKQHSLEKDKVRTGIYISDQYGNWQRSTTKLKRPMDSVILPQGKKDEILNDVNNFLGEEQRYASLGIPWRRGYLLYGPPGTGKTSFIMALAGKLEKNIYVINLSSSIMTDEILADLMSNAEEGCILLLEDVDGALSRISDVPRNNTNSFPEAEEEDVNKRKIPGELKIVPSGNLTFSGILNAFDGVGSQEGRLLFLTTNNPNILPKSLIRDGRIDVKINFANADRFQIEQLFLKFFPEQYSLATFFSQNLPEHVFSMSELQSYLMIHKHSPQSAIDNLHILQKKKSSQISDFL